MVMAQDSSEPTGIQGQPGGHGRPGNAVSRARGRKANAALDLWIKGVDPDTICQVLGYPTARAVRVAVERALEKNLHDTDKAILREFASRHYLALIQSVMGKALNPQHPEHLVANGRAGDLLSRWTKLMGLDAPTEVVVHTATTAELNAFVAKIITKGTPDVDEGDIFDVDVVDEEETGDAVQAG